MNKEGIEDRIKKISNNKNTEIYPKIPKNILIECSNICNLSCIFCANRKMTRKKEVISKTFVNRILKEAFKLGTREVGFYTTGEPLLNIDLEEYIEVAKKIGYEYIYITTNGVLAEIERIKKLVQLGLNSIKFSINAINRKDYEFIHGKDYYNKVMNNLKSVYKWRNEGSIDCKIYVSYISTRYTEYNIETIQNNFKNYSDNVLIMNVRNQSGLLPQITEELSNKNEKNKIQGKRILPCYYPFNTICITKEGYLTACCTDFQNYLAYADLNKTTLKEAWHSKKITELRKQHISGKLGKNLCNNCIYNSLELPQAISKKLSTNFNNDLLYNDKYMNEQILKYQSNK